MNKELGHPRKRLAGSRNRLLGVALLLLSACGQQQDIPAPPKAPPRPVTALDAISTADYVVPVRRVLRQRGQM